MTAPALLDLLRARGVVVRATGDTLDLDGPAEALTDDLLDRIRAAKPELLAALSQPDPAEAHTLALLKTACEGLALDPQMFGAYMSDDLAEVANGDLPDDVLRLCAATCRLSAGNLSAGELRLIQSLLGSGPH